MPRSADVEITRLAENTRRERRAFALHGYCVVAVVSSVAMANLRCGSWRGSLSVELYALACRDGQTRGAELPHDAEAEPCTALLTERGPKSRAG